jgi:hypothetical protein
VNPAAVVALTILLTGMVSTGLVGRHIRDLRGRYRAYLVRYPQTQWARNGWPPLAFRAWVTVAYHPNRNQAEQPSPYDPAGPTRDHDRYERYVGNPDRHIPPSFRWRLTRWVCLGWLWFLHQPCAHPDCDRRATSLHHIWYGNLYRERWLWDFQGFCWPHHTALHDFQRRTRMPLPVASYAYLLAEQLRHTIGDTA